MSPRLIAATTASGRSCPVTPSCSACRAAGCGPKARCGCRRRARSCGATSPTPHAALDRDGRHVACSAARPTFANGNTLDREGRIVHCSHGARAVLRPSRRHGDDPARRLAGEAVQLAQRRGRAADGTIWFTDPPYGIVVRDKGYKADSEIGACHVFRFDPATGELDGCHRRGDPNGLAFSPDESMLYVADTSAACRTDGGGNHHIRVYDVVEGRTRRTVACSPTSDPAWPTGSGSTSRATCTRRRSTRSRCSMPDGTRLGRIMVPERLSNCSRAGPTERVYITASSSLTGSTSRRAATGSLVRRARDTSCWSG